MSEEELHVPHEGHGTTPLSQWVAIFTAILAALGAVVGFEGSHLMNEVLLEKNVAVLRKAEASDEWNHYQSVSTKAHLAELAQQLVAPERAAQFDEKIQKYAAQKDELMAKARTLDSASEHADLEAEHLQKPHTLFASAMIFLQIAISLASITALTQRRWLFVVAFISAIVGTGLCGWALLMGG
jgi:hypothetical protein